MDSVYAALETNPEDSDTSTKLLNIVRDEDHKDKPVSVCAYQKDSECPKKKCVDGEVNRQKKNTKNQ